MEIKPQVLKGGYRQEKKLAIGKIWITHQRFLWSYMIKGNGMI